jgi:hypothetical protein
MGYGHLRAAWPLADALGTGVARVDQPPLAGAEEERLWRAARWLYEMASRTSQVPLVGAPLRALLESLTKIPHLHPRRDLSASTLQVHSLDRLIRKGLGAGLAARLKASGAPLLTTYFAAAVLAEHHGCERIYCVVTDVDLNRVWVPRRSRQTRIVYLTPSRRALERLLSYGVPRGQIELTGFPLPLELLGGPELPALRRNLAGRLVRLDPRGVFREQARNEIRSFLGAPLAADQEQRPPLATFSIGGAGAQAETARPLLRGLAPLIRDGRLRLCLAAGARPEVAARFRQWVLEAGLEEWLGRGVRIFLAAGLDDYFRAFNELLGETDVLWTKPSEMTFYAALGIPLVLAPPVGFHERYNRRWAVGNGAGLEQPSGRQAGQRLAGWLSEGSLAAAAWHGFTRLPKFGTYQILDRLARDRGGKESAG